MGLAPFAPLYIFEDELEQYGLDTRDETPDIMNLVGFASTLIDEYCGRLDGDGAGSLVYTTYVQRLLLQTRNRNMVYVPMRPIVGIPQATVNDLTALATAAATGNINPYYTGVQANTLPGFNTPLSGVVAASGRYGYTRQDMSIAYPDLWAFINPLNLITLFGGPAPWVPIDVGNTDYDPKTGEMWIPAGLQLQRYSEIILTYNCGYDPRNMPRPIKHVCASIVKNAQAKGDATTILSTMSVQGASNIGYLPGLIDTVLAQMLMPYQVVRAY